MYYATANVDDDRATLKDLAYNIGRQPQDYGIVVNTNVQYPTPNAENKIVYWPDNEYQEGFSAWANLVKTAGWTGASKIYPLDQTGPAPTIASKLLALVNATTTTPKTTVRGPTTVVQASTVTLFGMPWWLLPASLIGAALIFGKKGPKSKKHWSRK